MYIERLTLRDFRCFGEATLRLRHPGEDDASTRLPNINLILGDNGGGKSSVLRAAALTLLGPVLRDSGFVPYRLVRRPDAQESRLEILGRLQEGESAEDDEAEDEESEVLELEARLVRRKGGSLDRLVARSPIEEALYDDRSPAFFVAGYGATRRVETGDFVPSSIRRSRGLRYQRVAGLFEDHVPLRPLQDWLPKLEEERREEVTEIFDMVLPQALRFTSERDADDGEPLFTFQGQPTPFAALSDGYKAFIGWVSDLTGHLHDICPDDRPMREASGLVLVDEIDLHLHPEWQRQVVQMLATTFPRLQFVMTTHSPLIASSVERGNIFLTMKDEEGCASIGQIEETVYGRGVEQLLLSSYFGLESTRPASFNRAAQELFEQTAKGDKQAALAYLEQLAKAPSESEELTEDFARAKARRRGSKSP